jgi:hypothetical protein
MVVPESRRRTDSPSFKAFTEALLVLCHDQEPPTLYYDVADLSSEVRGRRIPHKTLQLYSANLETGGFTETGQRYVKHYWQKTGHPRTTIALTEAGRLHMSVVHLTHVAGDNKLSIEVVQAKLLDSNAGRIALLNLAGDPTHESST